jgi:signal transduction histidine kinase
MRSPLARLQAAIGLARQQPGRTEDSLQRIAREGERIDQLVGELLTLSRLEAGVTGELESVELGELLANIAEDARFEGAPRGVAIDCVAGATAEVQANPELLHRALENVVRNALRYSPEGGVVEIAGRRVGDRVFQITIADHGPGVAEADLAAIFTPFFRSEGQGAAGGYGLGLAIAQRAITALDGRISARNGSAGGLIVDIELPL